MGRLGLAVRAVASGCNDALGADRTRARHDADAAPDRSPCPDPGRARRSRQPDERTDGHGGRAWRGRDARHRSRELRLATSLPGDTVDIHMAVAALCMFNVTHEFTFGALFQRDLGAKGGVTGRRGFGTDIILS
jgi:hypothetical protein